LLYELREQAYSHLGRRLSSLTGGPGKRSGQTVTRPDQGDEKRGGGAAREVRSGSPVGELGRLRRVRLLPRRSIAALALAICALSVAGSAATSGSASATSLPLHALSSTSTTYPAGKQQLCEARAKLKTSVATLVKPSTLTSGRNAIKAAANQVKTNLTAFKKAAKGYYKPQINAVQAAVQQVVAAAGKLGNGQLSKNLQVVGSAITKVGTTTAALVANTKASCG
jgi:hypothetical protein